MRDHLHQILDAHFSSEAAGTQFTAFGEAFTPRNELAQLRIRCRRNLPFNYESGAGVLAEHVAQLVNQIYYALTGTNLDFIVQERTAHSEVVTDRVYRLQDRIKVLWEDKAPAVFDEFIGELQERLTAQELLTGLWPEPSSVTFDGYKAILGKVCAIISISSMV